MKNIVFIVCMVITTTAFCQDVSVVLKEASNFEKTLKEDQAIEKYKQALALDANNLTALVKTAELTAALGSRQQDKKLKKTYYEQAKDFASKAYTANPESADANYVMALTSLKLVEVETENKKLAAHIKDTKSFVDKAIAINPNHARANYLLGKWHFEMVQMPWAKKTAFKTLFGGLPDSKIEDAIKYLENCRRLDQYYVANYLELAKAYKHDNKPSPTIEILQKLVKLPNRTADDAALKAEGKKMLDEML